MKLDFPSQYGTTPPPSPTYADEVARLRVLEDFDADGLDGDPELRAIAEFAARLCDVPIAQVTVVEETRQRFLAGQGLDTKETPREVSFCQHAMVEGDLMEVRDATADPRFTNNALVSDPPQIRFYAGQPLVSDEGAPLGALCVIDTKANPAGLSDFQKQGMAVLGQAVMRRLQTRRQGLRAEAAIAEREERLRRMIDGVPQIAWSADSEGTFDYFNRRWRQETGAEPPRTTEDWRAFIHPEDVEKVFAEWGEAFDGGEEFESEYRLKQADGSFAWVLAQATPVADGRVGSRRWFGTITDIDEVHRLSESRDLLAKELSHRIKNIFAVVIGLISLSVRRQEQHRPFADELVETLRSLGRAHEFVRPTGGEVRDSLQGLLEMLFVPYTAAGEARVRISGDDAPIAHNAATPLALIFHELATNAAKYGALSSDDGHVALTVEDAGDMMVLRWEEIGGPAIAAPDSEGFGTRLIDMSMKGQLQGSWSRHFDQEGLRVELTVSKDAIAP